MQRSDRGEPVLSRRSFVGKIAVGAAAASAAVGLARAEAMPTRRESGPRTGGTEGPREAALDDATTSPAVSPAVELPVVAAPEAPREPAELAEAPPWELMRPLAMGSVVASGWRLVGLRGVADGSCVVTLMNDRGRTHRIHLCRNDGDPKGLVYTRQFDLVVMNGGQGDLPTDESLAQAVAALAHVLAANENDRRHASLVMALLSQGERARRFTTAAQLR